MNAGDVIVRLIADLKGFSGNIKTAVTDLNGFGAKAKASLAQARQSIDSGATSMQSFAKATKTAATDAEKALKRIEDRTKKLAGGWDFSAVAKNAAKNLKDRAIVEAADPTSLKNLAGNWGMLMKKMQPEVAAASAKAAAEFEKSWGASAVRATQHLGQFTKGAAGSFKNAATFAQQFSTKALSHIQAFASKASSALMLLPNKVMGAFGRLDSMLMRIFNFRNMAGAIAAGFAVREFATFDEQIAKIGTALEEGADIWLPKFRKAAQDMAVEFGESTASITTGMYEFLQALYSPADTLEMARTATIAARAGFTDTATAVKGLTSIMDAYGRETYSVVEVSDMLWQAVLRGKGEFSDWASHVGRAMAIAAEAGVSFEEVAGALASITRVIPSVDEAVTGLRQAIITLSGREEEAIAIAREYGVELSVSALRHNGLIGMVQKLATLTPEVRHEIFKEIRARTALNVLIKNQAALIEDVAAETKAAGSTQAAFDRATDNLMMTLRRLGQAMLAFVRGAVEPWKESIESFSKWVLENQDTIARWSRTVGSYLVYVKDVFASFVNTLRESPKEGFRVLIESLIEVMKAAAKIAVDLAVRIGKGIWQGVKESVFGGINEQELKTRTMKLYKTAGFKSQEQKTLTGVGFGGVKSYQTREVPEDEKAYRVAEQVVREQMSQENVNRITEPIMAGFADNAKAGLDEAFDNIVDSSTRLASGVEEANKDLQARLAQIAQDYPEKSEGQKAIDAFWVKLDGQIQKVGQGFRRLKKDADESIPGPSPKLTLLISQLKREQEVLKLLTQGKYRDAELQRVLNELYAQGANITAEQADELRKLLDEKGSQQAGAYLRQLEEENAIYALETQSLVEQAEKLRIINDLKRQGIELNAEQEARLEAAIALHRKYEKVGEVGQALGQGMAAGMREFTHAVQEGENAWKRLGDVALSTIRRIEEALIWKPMEEALTAGATKAVGSLTGAKAETPDAGDWQKATEVSMGRVYGEGADAAANAAVTTMGTAATTAATELTALGASSTTSATGITTLGTASTTSSTGLTALGAAVTAASTATTGLAPVLTTAAAGVSSLAGATTTAAAQITAAAAQIAASAAASGVGAGMAQGGLVKPAYAEQGGVIQQLKERFHSVKERVVHAASGGVVPPVFYAEQGGVVPKETQTVTERIRQAAGNVVYAAKGGLIERKERLTQKFHDTTEQVVYAAKGIFQPRGTDTVPAMLTPGELVLPVDVTKKIAKLLNSGKSAAVTAYRAMGGMVPQPAYVAASGRISRPLYAASGGIVYARAGVVTPQVDVSYPQDNSLEKKLDQMLRAPRTSEPPQSGKPVVFNINAIDSASVVQMLQRHGKELAAIVGGEQGNNHPSRRNAR